MKQRRGCYHIIIHIYVCIPHIYFFSIYIYIYIYPTSIHRNMLENILNLSNHNVIMYFALEKGKLV